MESLFLSAASQGRRVCLYAVPDGVPLYFKHNELMLMPGYQLLWRGHPNTITELQAARWVTHCSPSSLLYRNYQLPAGTDPGLLTAIESFQSAVHQLSKVLEYVPGMLPQEVLIGEIPIGQP